MKLWKSWVIATKDFSIFRNKKECNLFCDSFTIIILYWSAINNWFIWFRYWKYTLSSTSSYIKCIFILLCNISCIHYNCNSILQFNWGESSKEYRTSSCNTNNR